MICAFGDFELDAALFELRRAGQPVALEPKVFDLLSYLVLHEERVVTRDEIFAALWPNEFVSDGALSYAVRAARKAIGDDGRRQGLIRTVHRRGFRFVGTVVRCGDAPPPRPAAAALRPPQGFPFVGREAELTELVAGLDALSAGRGALYLLSGEPGIGKTRLVQELAAVAVRRGMRVLVGRSHESGGAPAYSPWMDALGSFVRTESEADLRAALGDTASEVAALLPELGERLPQLPNLPTMDPERARFRMFDSVARFLARAAWRVPLVVVLDDLHWADVSSLLLLQFVAREIAQNRLLVLGTHRDLVLACDHPLLQTLGNLARVDGCHRLALTGLSAAEVGAFVRGTSGVDPPAAVIDSIHRETDGNPFFVTELVRLLDDSAHLPAPPGRGLIIPPTVREAIAARVGALSAGCSLTLESAAVIGREFDVPLLAAVVQAECPHSPMREATLQAIDEAVGVRLIEAVGADAVQARLRRYRFVHSLVREVVYESLGGHRQTRLHGVVGESLERRGAPQAGRHLGELAHHFSRAGDQYSGRAVDYCVAAAAQATSLLAYEDASAHYEQALRLLEPGVEQARRRCEILLALGWSHWQSNDAALARPVVREAAELARAIDAPVLLAQAALSYGDSFRGFEMGVYEPQLVELLESALTGLSADEDGWRARVMARLAVALYHADGSQRRRHALSLDAVRASRRAKDAGAELATLYSRHWAIWGPDSLASRVRAATQMSRLAARLGDVEMSFHAHRFRFMDLLEAGDSAALERELQRCEQLAAQLGQPYYGWYVETFRALRAFLDGRFEACEQLAQKAAAIGQRAQNQNVVQILGIQTFAVRREQGRLAELHDAIGGFIGLYPKIPGWRAALALICAETGDLDEARRQLDSLAADEFAVLPRDAFWLANMAALADVCAVLGDTVRAPVLYRLLKPLAALNATLAPGAACNGSVARVLGRLSATLRLWDRAARHFDAALEANRRLGAPHFVAHTQAQYGEMLLARGRAGDAARAARLIGDADATYRRLGMPPVARAKLQRGACLPASGVGTRIPGVGARRWRARSRAQRGSTALPMRKAHRSRPADGCGRATGAPLRMAVAGRRYFTANGFSGEPMPPAILSGGAEKRNSQTPSAAQSSASASRSNISPRVRPMSRRQSKCSGRGVFASSNGMTSTELVSAATAATSRPRSHAAQAMPSPGIMRM